MADVRVEAKVLDDVWHALGEPIPRCFVGNERARAERMAAALWVDRIDIGDLLEDWDARLRGIDIFALANAVGLPTRVIYSLTGRKTQRTIMGHDRIHRADAAALMIVVEQMGFRVDPTEMVQAVLPTLKEVRLATSGEVDVLRFATHRHKMAPLAMSRAGSDGAWGRTKVIANPEGYEVTAFLDADGKLLILEFASPRFRRRPEPVLTDCAECGMTYMRGDPEDSASHRREHRKYLSVADPQPNPRAAAAQADGWDGRVDASSPKWMHKEVYQRARLFKREFQYDFVQWSSDGERGSGVVGFLFTDPAGNGKILGACCFRWRAYADGPHCWALAWIWLAPCARRMGLLSARWPSFLKEFGAFHVEPPLSDAMQAFLEKHGLPEAVVAVSDGG